MKYVSLVNLDRPKTGFENACLRDCEDDAVLETHFLAGKKTSYTKAAFFLVNNPSVMLDPLTYVYFWKLVETYELLSKRAPNKSYFLSTFLLSYAIPKRQGNKIFVRHHNDESLYFKTLSRLSESWIKFFAFKLSYFFVQRQLNWLGKLQNITHVFFTQEDLDQTLNRQTRLNINNFLVKSINFVSRVSVPAKPISRIVFFGSPHGPNIEAVDWIIDSLTPNLFLTFELELVIIGKFEVVKNKSDRLNITFLEWIDEPFQFDPYETLYLLPAFSGSGIKMKIVDAIEAGVRVCTNQQALSGIHANVEIALSNNKKKAQQELLEYLEKKCRKRLY